MDTIADPEVVTIAKAAELLRVSEATIGRMLNAGTLSSVKIGRLRRIHLESIDRLRTKGARRIA